MQIYRNNSAKENNILHVRKVRRGVCTPHVLFSWRRPLDPPKLRNIRQHLLQGSVLGSCQKRWRLKKKSQTKTLHRSVFPEPFDTPERQPEEPFWSVKRRRDRLVIFFLIAFSPIMTHPPNRCNIFSNKVYWFKRRGLVKGLRFFCKQKNKNCVKQTAQCAVCFTQFSPLTKPLKTCSSLGPPRVIFS